MSTSCCWAAAVDSGIYEPEGATWTSSKSCCCMLGHFLSFWCVGGSWTVIIWEHFFLVLASSKIGKLLFSVVMPIPQTAEFNSRFWKWRTFSVSLKCLLMQSNSLSLSFQPLTKYKSHVHFPVIYSKSPVISTTSVKHFSCCSSQRNVDSPLWWCSVTGLHFAPCM